MVLQRNPTVACYRDGILNRSQPELSCCPCRPLCGSIDCSHLWAESSMVAGRLELSCCFLVLRVVTFCLLPLGLRVPPTLAGLLNHVDKSWLVDCGRTDATRG